ncbi:hypothetical protein TSUD_261850 [Trifolium subterraneum]|nr:hypothetical protein TSUD_261850 [Trifolium subterraneum]
MGKGTGSFGKRRNKTHTLCVRCGRRSFHLQKSRCSACAYPAARVRKSLVVNEFAGALSSAMILMFSSGKAGCLYRLDPLYLSMSKKIVLSYLDSAEVNVSVEEDSYIELVRVCDWKRARKEGSKVYSYVRKSFMMTHLNLKLGNALLSMFVRFGNLVDAWYVFAKMPERNLFSWNVLVGGYAKGDERLGREIHDYVMRTEFSSENLVYNSLIQMYSSVGRVKEAEIFSLKQNAEMSFLMKLHLYPYYVLAADPEENKGTIRREISVRDADRFHHFKGGICSCIAWRKVISYEALLTLAVSRVEH